MWNQDPFEYYVRESEPDKRYKGYIWHTAIGLQAVDGLLTSEYLQNIAKANIDGKITINEAEGLINRYYEENPIVTSGERTEEADKVSLRIAKILSEMAFSFTPNEYISIHRKLFLGIYDYAGQIRNYNIKKKEWILGGESVIYGSASELRATLDYDFYREKQFNYKGLNIDEIIQHLACFISELWQIHIFGEGNTRTTAVFFIKYLRTLGFNVTNEIFAKNAWYFRNALVRANYNNIKKGIHTTTKYLELFLRNLILGETNQLHNRSMHISGLWNELGQMDIQEEKVDIQEKKVDIQEEKVDIQEEKVDIQLLDIFSKESLGVSDKTISHINKIFEAYRFEEFFSRADVEKTTGLKSSRASMILNKLIEINIITAVKGHGKGKYRFVNK